MARFNSEETLWTVFPMILVIILLIAGIIFLPQAQTDVRSRASSPTPAVITPFVSPKPQVTTRITPEIVCSELYSPVCGVNGQTYPNSCEANVAGVTSFTIGTCKPTATPTKTNTLRYTLPATN